MSRHIVASMALAGWLATGYTLAKEPIPLDEFGKLHTLIKPHSDERNWERIPWMTDLWQARRRAAELGKPSHPLGCV